jgi:hypothetical protein
MDLRDLPGEDDGFKDSEGGDGGGFRQLKLDLTTLPRK